jgi:hypothetical protein
MWRTRLRAVGFLKRRGIIWLAKRLTDFIAHLQSLIQCLSFLVWTAIDRIRSASPLKRNVLLCVSLLFNWYHGSLQGVKRPERVVVHSPPSSDEVQNEWNHFYSLYMSLWHRQVQLYLFTFYPRVFIWIFCVLSAVLPHTLARFIFKTTIYCLVCNTRIFSHAVSNTGCECRINVQYETTN